MMSERLSCSAAASADYLVTGDSDLLEVQEFRGTWIITPRDLEMLFEDLSHPHPSRIYPFPQEVLKRIK
jgi:hypothetical protein